MSKQSEAVKRWRKRSKRRMVEAMGGACVICGYSSCHQSLDLHHLDPDEKGFGFGAVRANIRSWDALVEEMRKCVLLCKNCHGEVHSGLVLIPKDAPRFNEEYADYRDVELYDTCPVCGGKKRKVSGTCSYECAGRKAWKVDWDSVDLHDLIHVQKLPFTQLGEQLGVTDNAVRKAARRRGII